MINKMVKKGRSIIQLIVTGIVISHLMLTSTAHAITVQYELIPLGDNQYRYVYTVTNDGSLGAGRAVSLFDLVFDSASYQETSLAIVTSAPLNSQWDEFILSSIFEVPAAYSAFSSTIGIAQGETVSGFAVEFEWIGGAALPGEQAFQVFDPNTFDLLEEGTTILIGESRPQFAISTVEVAENADTVTLTVRRIGGSDGELTVNYATTDGTATDGSDYVGTTGSLTWADGDSSDKTFTVTIRDDGSSEGNETFTVALSDPISGESLGSATVTITDNDNGQPGTPQFTDFNPKVAENVGAVTLTVSRVGRSDGELTVNYATTDGTATDGNDYSGSTGTLTWADGDNSDKTFTVTIRDDRNPEEPETFTVTLYDPNSGESLDSATITIVDNIITPVTLVDFSATALETEIHLEWQSAIELDNAGFHIWRATGEGWRNGDYSTVIRLTDQLIPAQGNSTPYSYTDTNVETGLTYYYALEDIDLTGHSTLNLDYIDSATAK